MRSLSRVVGDNMEKYEHPITPAELSPALVSLCQEIVPGGTPIYVDVHPVQGQPSNECFPIVEDRVRREGGGAVCGWSLWEMPTVFIEAEFHAVWRSPSNELFDIAMKKRPTQRILFLADPRRRYEGHQINNIRKPLNRHPAVVGFLNTFDEEFDLMNRGERAYQHGDIILDDDEALEFQDIQRSRALYELEILRLIPEIGPYGPCWCGSGKKVKWCHGVSS
jgi:hypothetical protein